MIKNRSFAIIGGGIGGLTLAIALQRNGFKVNVYEKAPEFRSLGAGIVLAANAMKAFRSIGLEEEVVRVGRQLKTFYIKDVQGKILRATNAEQIDRKFGPVTTLTLHRADLHQVLIRALQPGTIKFNKACSRFEESGEKIKLFFQDGNFTEEDYVIAADGIHSIFRKNLLPLVQLRYSGYTCWRAVIDSNNAAFPSDVAAETWGPGMRFGIVPLTRNRIYWYATLSSSESDGDKRAYTIKDLLAQYKKFHAPVLDVISASKTEQLIKNDICDVLPLKRFAFGKIVLLGDAAHATTPNLGQGACMAIEDAVVLANCLKKSENAEQAFLAYEKMRIGRTSRIVNASYNMGRLAQIKNPFLIKLRNMAMKFAPETLSEKQLKFLYEVNLDQAI